MIEERPSEPREGDEPPSPRRIAAWRMPLDFRSTALVVLAVLACVYTLHWASAVFVPLMFGLMFSYALAPVVDRLQRWRIPRAIAAGGLILGLLIGVGSLIYSLSDDATELIEELPTAAQQLRQRMRSAQGEPEGPMEKCRRPPRNSSKRLKKPLSRPPSKGVTRVQIEQPKFNVNDYLWAGTLGLFGLVGQITIVAFLTFFMLATGNNFRRKLVKIAADLQRKAHGGGGARRDHAADPALSAGAAVRQRAGGCRDLARLSVDRRRPCGRVGRCAGVLNLIPYIGAIVFTAGAALLAFLQFGTFEMTLLVGGASLVIQVSRATCWRRCWPGRIARMNAVVVFAGVLAVGLAVGRVGHAARPADPDGRQGRLRPRRRPEAGRRAARRLNVSPAPSRMRSPRAP